MKKLILSLIVLSTLTLTAQNTQNPFQHEVKIDGAKLAFAGIIEASYEFVGKESSGYGISILINSRENDVYFEKVSVTPFYRMYFFNRKDYGAKGLFVEGFSKFSFGTDDSSYYGNYGDGDDYFDAALGLSIGKKWVNRNGFVLEIFAGGGRTLGFSNASPDGFFRGGIFLGKRF